MLDVVAGVQARWIGLQTNPIGPYIKHMDDETRVTRLERCLDHAISSGVPEKRIAAIRAELAAARAQDAEQQRGYELRTANLQRDLAQAEKAEAERRLAREEARSAESRRTCGVLAVLNVLAVAGLIATALVK